MRPDLFIEREPERILAHIEEIVALADSERSGLGFLPEQALRDGIVRGKLLALFDRSLDPRRLVGYVLYSGVFPYAKIQQIATINSYRQQGVASALIRALVDELERFGFMTIRAHVASDLIPALAFYRKNGFERVRTQPGGASRQRQIVVHVRELDTDTLFSRENGTADEIDLGIRGRSAREAPFFALDLNVYFDLVRNRSQSESARRLFGAALAHTVRLAVADEFVGELRRTSDQAAEDPILQLALRLPRIPKADASQLQELRDQMHDVVFIQGEASGAGSTQAWSDAGHLAHAALARASAFVTRDGSILRSRAELLRRFGIDILSVDEVLMVLPSDADARPLEPRYGVGFVCADVSARTVRGYMEDQSLPRGLVDEFAADGEHSARIAISRNDDVVACAVLLEPRTPQPVCRLFIHGRPETLDVELYVDHLLDAMLRRASATGARVIELERMAGQSTVTTAARACGFVRQPSTSALVKVVMGRPVTITNWKAATRELRLRTGLELPAEMPTGPAAERFSVKTGRGEEISLSLKGLENLLGPTLLIRADQDGVIVPIARDYSKDLLGADRQMSLGLVHDKDAGFRSQRVYVNTPRAVNAMRPELPILFYESMNRGGRGCIVAVARIVDAEIRNKADIPKESRRRLVVEVESFSKSDELLVTSFENTFLLPRPVPLDWLKKVGAVDNANLVTAKWVSSCTVAGILDRGWGE